MIISFDHKFIFFGNGKTGTTSVVKALTPYDQNRDRRYSMKAENLFAPKHLPPSLLKAMLPARIWEECFKFTFVRNPYDWLVSQWFYNFQFRKNPRFLDDPGQWLRRRYHPYLSIMGRSHRELCGVRKFTVEDIDFIYRYLALNYRSLPYRPGKLQISYVLDADDNMIIDYIGRFESLEQDFRNIVDKIGLRDVTLPKVNVSKHRGYEEYYTEESARRVYELWQPDFDVLGYDRL